MRAILYFIKINFLFFVFILFNKTNFSQLQSVNIFGDYSSVLSKRISVTQASSLGGGIEVRFKLSENFSLGLIGSYQLFNIEQDDELNKWNWEFWNLRYKGITQSDLTDTNLRAVFTSVQKMDLFPFLISLNYNYALAEKFIISSAVGGGILFYTKKLYLDEYWEKKFNQIGYMFSYSYHNFAPDKNGNPIALMLGLNLSYEIFNNFRIASIFNFLQVIKTNGKLGYDEFPFNNSMSFKIGLTFIY